MELIKSISYENDEILSSIIKLHNNNNRIQVDCCYSKGIFYKSKKIEEPTYKFDIHPYNEEVMKCDCRKLPFKSEEINSLIYDPPFLATKGKSLDSEDDNNIINKRFGVYPSEKELHNFYLESLKEFYRILKDKGILIVKCQDKISSGTQYMSHVFIINEAEKLGFYTKDLFILLAKNRIVANWQLKNQKNARKFHSYFIVFEKTNKKISYI